MHMHVCLCVFTMMGWDESEFFDNFIDPKGKLLCQCLQQQRKIKEKKTLRSYVQILATITRQQL